MLTLWFRSFLDLQTGLCYLIKDCICCCHSSPASWPMEACRVRVNVFPSSCLDQNGSQWMHCGWAAAMLGEGGELIQAVLAHVYLTGNERLSQNISIRGALWWAVRDYSWFSHSLWCLSLCSCNPERLPYTRLWWIVTLIAGLISEPSFSPNGLSIQYTVKERVQMRQHKSASLLYSTFSKRYQASALCIPIHLLQLLQEPQNRLKGNNTV